MKKLIPLAMMVVLAFASLKVVINPVLAGAITENYLTTKQECRSQQVRSAVVITTSISESSCPRTNQLVSMRYPPVVAVSCASTEWCCKHDIGGTGQCTRCCAKP